MAKVEIKLNRSGVRQLLRSDEMLQICKEHAYKARAKLGSGYEVTYRKGKNRANAEVAAVTRKAKRDNWLHNSILKALR